MPFKYKLYNIICYLLIVATAVIFINMVIELSVVGGSVPFWGFLILLAFFGSYFTFPVFGIGLIKALNNNQETTLLRRRWIRIIFSLLIAFQGLLVYNSIQIIRVLLFYFRNQYPFYDQRSMLMGVTMVLMCLFTFYLLVFVFPLMKAVKENYRSLFEQIDNIGAGGSDAI